MKALFLGLGLVGALGFLGCGGGSSTCQTGNCPSPSTKTYQVCGTQGSSNVTYNYNGQSCSCDVNAAGGMGCTDCATKVATYCQM